MCCNLTILFYLWFISSVFVIKCELFHTNEVNEDKEKRNDFGRFSELYLSVYEKNVS